jgi:hypothetical protein
VMIIRQFFIEGIGRRRVWTFLRKRIFYNKKNLHRSQKCKILMQLNRSWFQGI